MRQQNTTRLVVLSATLLVAAAVLFARFHAAV
jgi:hypothetical protein